MAPTPPCFRPIFRIRSIGHDGVAQTRPRPFATCPRPREPKTVGRKRPRAKQRSPGRPAALIAGIQGATEAGPLANGGAMMSPALSPAAGIQGPWGCSSGLSRGAIVLVPRATKQKVCTTDNIAQVMSGYRPANSAPGVVPVQPPRQELGLLNTRPEPQGAKTSFLTDDVTVHSTKRHS